MVEPQQEMQSEKQSQGLLGSAVLAIWSAIESGSEDEFNDWYTHEHLPERVGIPGFLRGRRYAMPAGISGQRMNYFTIYETENLNTLASPAYLERLDNPTDWTRKMAPLFETSNRTACSVTATCGQGVGGYAATLEFSPDENGADGLRTWLTTQALPAALERPGLVGIHLCEADVQVTQAKDQTEESKAVRGRAPIPRWFVLVEATGEDVISAVGADLCSDTGVRGHGAADDLTFSRYHLMLSLG